MSNECVYDATARTALSDLAELLADLAKELDRPDLAAKARRLGSTIYG